MNNYRICKKCGRNLPLDNYHYHKDGDNIDGYKTRCKECINGDKYKFVNSKDELLCKKCGKILPKTSQFFNINTKSGNFTSPCRKCIGLQYGGKRYTKNSLTPINKEYKVCSTCFRELPKKINYFYKNALNKDGLQYLCRECCGSVFILETDTNHKFCKKCQKIYPKTEKYFYRDSSKIDNLSTVCKQCRQKYNKNNNKRRASYTRNRKKVDINYRLVNSLRNRVYHAVKGNTKSKSTLELLGCPVEEFKDYLEMRFSSSMSWENYGKVWHIDHIVPCKFFDLTKESDQIKCFNYSNMQPMFKVDNLKKQATNKNKVFYSTSKFFYNNKEQLLIDKEMIIYEK